MIRNLFKLAVAIAISEIAGVIGAVFTTPAIPGWYAGLVKPPLTPPSWLFAPVWTVLYFLIGVALYLAWKNDWNAVHPLLQGERKAWNRWSERLWTGDWQKINTIAIFGVQYVLNILWSYVFFGLHAPGFSFFILVALWFAIVYTIVNFYRISKAAAYLLVPYIIWVSFAGYLNFAIWQMADAQSAYCVQNAALCFGSPDRTRRVGPLVPAIPRERDAEYKNGTYTVDGKAVTLLNGVSDVPIAVDSASHIITRYFGNETFGDLNGDGVLDVAFLLTQNGGGSGTFYYAVAALKTDSGYQRTNAILLGDRIAPQTTEIRNGEIIVNYAERTPGEPMTAQPSVGVSKYLSVENGTLIEWKLSEDVATGISFRYPEQIGTTFIYVVRWPPRARILNELFTCAEAGSEIMPSGKTEQRVVNGHAYCITTQSEGAAGSIYTTYTYTFPEGSGAVAMTFTLRFVQCGNYDEPQRTSCETERESFDIDRLIDKIVETGYILAEEKK